MENCEYKYTFVGNGQACTYGVSSISWMNCPECKKENCPLNKEFPESFADAYARRWKQKFEVGDIVYPPDYMIFDRFGEILPQMENATIIEAYDDGFTYKAKRENGTVVDVHCFEVELFKE